MSRSSIRSPRRNLVRALQALDEVLAVCDLHPEARAELVEVAGEDGLRDLQASRDRLAEIVSRIEARRSAPDTE